MGDRVGQLLGNYRLIQLLGQGNWATVYLGEHQHLQTRAAIKVLHGSLAQGDVEGFLTEARTLAHLRHPHIVQVLDFGVQEASRGKNHSSCSLPLISRYVRHRC
jgi:serine/threonine protein kinase